MEGCVPRALRGWWTGKCAVIILGKWYCKGWFSKFQEGMECTRVRAVFVPVASVLTADWVGRWWMGACTMLLSRWCGNRSVIIIGG